MKKRKIGLALGSGAARGWAHIGVINALQAQGFHFDIVAGCSAGALVGAAYATHKLARFEKWVRSFTYWDVVKMTDLSWRKGGLLRGDRVFDAVGKILEVDNIEQCAMPFGAVVTNLTTGRELWLTEGNLRQSIRASCSMPGLLSPVWHDGYWLVDGAVVNPLPISLARALGADFVVAVDLQHDASLQSNDFLPVHPDEQENGHSISHSNERGIRERITELLTKKKHPTPSAIQIMGTSIEMLENRLKNTRLANDPPDVIIRPDCSKLSLLDFHRAEEAIEFGYQAVMRKQNALEKLKINMQQ